MKTILKFLIAGAATAALSTTFTACNTSGGTSIVPVSPTDLPEEVSAFFEDPKTIKVLGNTIFLLVGGVTDSCVMINNKEQLPDIHSYGEYPEYPEIDFNSYTLVLGVVSNDGGEYIASRNLTVDNEIATMNVNVKTRKEEGVLYPAMSMPVYFWGIYPKITATTIQINATHQK